MLKFDNPTVTIEDTRYDAELMKVERVSLEVEDHGILTSYLHLVSLDGGTGQGFGGYSLDYWEEAENSRVGSSWGMDYIMNVLRVFGPYADWNKLVGRTVYALRASPYGRIEGILSSDRKEYFFPMDLTHRV